MNSAMNSRPSATKALLVVVPLLLAAVPAALDPVRVAPHIYDVAFENERVRVLLQFINDQRQVPVELDAGQIKKKKK